MRCVLWTVLMSASLAAPMAHAQSMDAERVRIEGSNTVGNHLMPTLAQSWLRDIGYERITTVRKRDSLTEIHASRDGQPLVVEIVSSDSARGFDGLVDGQAQIAMMTRRPSVEELDAAWQLGNLSSPEQEFVIALDGVAIVVNERNRVNELSLLQLQQVFSGAARDWSGVGAGSGGLRIHRMAASASRDLVDERVMRGARHAGTGLTHSNSRALLAAVAADPLAIGFVSLRAPLPEGVRAIAVSEGGQAIAPSRLGVLSEDYPLTRRLYLYGGQMMGALSRSLALYSMTLSGQRAVDRAGHLALTLRPGRRVVEVSGPGDYREIVGNAVRLPISLRFNFSAGDSGGAATSIYDSRTTRDIERIAAFMRLPPYRDRKLVLVGFVDPDAGSSVASLLVSNDRADMLAQELMALGVAVESARGMGNRLPVVRSAANRSRYRNERVEVWVL